MDVAVPTSTIESDDESPPNSPTEIVMEMSIDRDSPPPPLSADFLIGDLRNEPGEFMVVYYHLTLPNETVKISTRCK